MLNKLQIAWTISGLMVASIAGAQAVQTVYASQDVASLSVQISDSKLGPINMGLDSAQHWLTKMTPGDVQRGQKLINDLERLAARFQRIPASNDPQYQYVASRFAEIARATINKAKQQGVDSTSINSDPQIQNVQSPSPERLSATQRTVPQKQVVKPHRNLPMIQSTLKQVVQGLREYQADEIVEAQHLTEKMHYAEKLYQQVPESLHPDYAETKKLMESARVRLAQVIPQWTRTDDPHLFLSRMNQRYREELSLPEYRNMMKSRELTAEDVQYYIGSIEAFNADIETDLSGIIAAVISTRSRREVSLISWLQKGAADSIATTTAHLKKGLDDMVNKNIDDASRLAGLDPESNRYQFVTESVRKNHEENFARTLRTIENARALELHWQEPGRWSSRLVELNRHIADYREKVALANTVERLPDDIDNAALKKIARETLAIEKYAIGEIKKLIVNSKKIQRDRKTSRWFDDRLETTVRVWEEFQVCTVEIEDGKLVVYFNTLRNFSRGAATTPIDTWIVANRLKSGEISPSLLN